MPKECGRNANQRPVREFGPPSLDHVESLLVYHHLVVAGLDQPPGDVLDLLARLDEKVVSLRDLDWDALARVACPYVQARIPGPAMDSEKIEVRMKARQDGILLSISPKVRGSGSKKMWPEYHQRLSLRSVLRHSPVSTGLFERLRG